MIQMMTNKKPLLFPKQEKYINDDLEILLKLIKIRLKKEKL